jgi:hypothetical protein
MGGCFVSFRLEGLVRAQPMIREQGRSNSTNVGFTAAPHFRVLQDRRGCWGRAGLREQPPGPFLYRIRFKKVGGHHYGEWRPRISAASFGGRRGGGC